MKVAYCCTSFQFKYITSFFCSEVNEKVNTYIFYEKKNFVDVYIMNSNNTFDIKHSFFIGFKKLTSCWSFVEFLKDINMQVDNVDIYSPHFVNLVNQLLIKIIPKERRTIWCFYEGTAAYNVAIHKISFLNKFKRKVFGVLKFGINSISTDYMYGHFDDIYGFLAPEPHNVYHKTKFKICFKPKSNYPYKESTNSILLLGTYYPNNKFLSDLINYSMIKHMISINGVYNKYFKGHPNYYYEITNFTDIDNIENISAEDCLYDLSPEITIAGFGSFLLNTKEFFNDNTYLILYFQSVNQINLFKRLEMKCDRAFFYKGGKFIEIDINEEK